METRSLTLAEAAAHIHVDVASLKHAAQRGEIAAKECGGDWRFFHRDLDEWAQRAILAAPHREQERLNREFLADERLRSGGRLHLSELFAPGAVELGLAGRTKAGVIRDMCDLAARTGFVYDPEGLFAELKAREEVSSTAVGEGAAFLHPRFHDPYLFERSFVAYGRSPGGVYFGAPDGEMTHHFFLIASTDHDEHLRILSRLAVMVHSTEFIALLAEAADEESARTIIRSAEEGVTGGARA